MNFFKIKDLNQNHYYFILLQTFQDDKNGNGNGYKTFLQF